MRLTVRAVRQSCPLLLKLISVPLLVEVPFLEVPISGEPLLEVVISGEPFLAVAISGVAISGGCPFWLMPFLEVLISSDCHT
ncbi:hypothetical protein GE09DRAFT_1085552 [Coniochaeta sp. 2T2.1]|nr:hypothetical protein GE09DRAFT_1085552 [Coniochaeta sp. 2T2.1]